MKEKRKIFYLSVSLVVLFSVAFLFASQEFSIPNAFKISPSRSNFFEMIKIVYNPQIDRYVVFFFEFAGSNFIVCSRLYSSKGKPAGKLQQLLNKHYSELCFADIAYNKKNNQFLLIWSDGYYDKITGKLLDGEGKDLTAGKEGDLASKEVVIKPASGYNGDGFYPRAVWIPGKNQYAVAWFADYRFAGAGPTHPKNGYYFASLTSKLRKKVKPKMVRHQTTKNQIYFVRTLIASENKLLWGGADDFGTWKGSWSRPMVFFTDLEGDMTPRTTQDTASVIYPGPKVKALGLVGAAYNPSSDIILLYWTKTDNMSTSKQTYRELFYRMMDIKGKFKSGKKRIPKKTNFQTSASAKYNSVEDRFFLVYPEYKVLYEATDLASFSVDKYKSFWGGKLWGLYISNKGKIVDKDTGSAIPLTDVFKEENERMRCSGIAYNSVGNEFFITYDLINNISYFYEEIWGLIYK